MNERSFERHKDAAYRMVDGAAIIVMPRQARVYTLNRVGSHIWDVLDGREVEAVAASVEQAFDVSSEQALADTSAFLRTLTDKGLVTVRGG